MVKPIYLAIFMLAVTVVFAMALSDSDEGAMPSAASQQSD